MEMYQVIRYFLNEMEKKIWHALLTLVLFCLYILEILEVCILPLVILFAYIYIYLRVHGEGFSYIRESLLQQELTYSMKWFLCLGSLAPLFFFLSTLNLAKRVRQKKTWNHENPCLF